MCTFLQNNWSDFVINFIGAFLGFGFALLIEYLKKRSDNKKEKRNQEKEKKQKIEYYKLLLEEVLRISLEQIDSIEKYIEKQNKSYFNLQVLQRIPTNSFTRLKTIDNKGVFEALAEKFNNDNEWLKKYNSLNSTLDFLEGVICEELLKINRRTLEVGYNDLMYVKNLIDEIPDILLREALKKAEILGEKKYENPEYDFINYSILKYHELMEKKADFGSINNELLFPLLNNILPFSSHPYAQEVIFNAKNSRVRLTDIENNIKQTIKTHCQMTEQLKDALIEVKNMIQIL